MLVWLMSAAPALTPTVGLALRPIQRPPPETTTEQLQYTVAPPLAPYGGVRVGRWSFLGSLGIATTQVTARADDVVSRQRAGLIRPGVDVRLALLDEPDGVPSPFVLLGVHGTFPIVGDRSTGFTEEEQAVADRLADEMRSSLGRLGGRAGAGVVLDVHRGLGLGFELALDWSRSFLLGRDEAGTVMHAVSTDAAVLLQLEW